jgi:hypothetical protein
LLAQLLEPPRYGSVCQVVWEGRSREAPPYPDLWHKREVLMRAYNVGLLRQSRPDVSEPRTRV